jgi:D-lactate dehydrogenase (cytochrome)
LNLFNLVQARTGGLATACELIKRLAIEFAVKYGPNIRDPLSTPQPWYVLLELSSSETEGLRDTLEGVLAAGLEAGLIADATIAASLAQRQEFWKLREVLPEVQKPEGGSIKHDVSVPLAHVPAFLAEADAAVEALIPGARPVPFGHLGDGNMHYNVTQPAGADREKYLARWYDMNAAVHAVVRKYGGSISAEHGIGVMKRKLLPEVKDPVALDLMRALKRTLDPQGILNPGKVL